MRGCPGPVLLLCPGTWLLDLGHSVCLFARRKGRGLAD